MQTLACWPSFISPTHSPSGCTSAPECGCRSPDRVRSTTLLAVIRQDTDPEPPPIVAEADRLYLGYDCFRNPELSLPDDLFRLTESAASTIATRLELAAVAWSRLDDATALTISMRSWLDPSVFSSASVDMTIGAVSGVVDVRPLDDDTGTLIRGQFPVTELVANCPPAGDRWEARVRLELLDSTGHAPVCGSAPLGMGAHISWRGRPHRLRPYVNKDGVLVVHVVPITIRRIAGKLRRSIRGGGR